MPSHPTSNAVARGSTSMHHAPSHLDEIRRLINDCRSGSCPCGATELYAEFNRIERRHEHHRRLSDQCMNRLDRDGPTDPHHQRDEEEPTRADASPRARQRYQNLPALQQDGLPHQRLAVPPPVATPSQASTSRGVLSTQTGLSDPSPSHETSQLVPRQENHHTGPSRKRKLQDPSKATNGLALNTGADGDSGSDVPITARKPQRFRPSITGDIRDAEVARERANMIAMFGPPVYGGPDGPVDIRDRIGARAVGRRHRVPSRDSSPRPPPRPRGRRRGEAEVLLAHMTKVESETYRQHASTADVDVEPRRRLPSRRVRNMRT